MTKVCTSCNEEKSLDLFSKRKGYKDGIFSRCKECHRKYNRDYKKNRDPIKKKEQGRRNKLKQSYGITVEHYNTMLKQQNHKCAICKTDEVDAPKNRLFVDHCHSTGNIRGLLCARCNTGIGMLKDNIEVLKDAITYLENAK